MADRPETRVQPAVDTLHVFAGGRWHPVLTPEDVARARHESYWRGVLTGVALGIPATATAAWLMTGVNLLFWWL